MTWWAIDVRTPAEQRDRLGAWLVSVTGQAVEEQDDGTLVAFAPDEESAKGLIAELDRSAECPVEARRRSLAVTDWSTKWREGLTARRLGRLTVVPSWLPEAAAANPATVVLDPETAFGSGEHGSTRAALKLMDSLVRPGCRVMDLGSGSGILSIAAIKLGAATALGIEIDGEANQVARRNAVRNRVADRVEFLEGDAASLSALAGPVDLILSNILRTVNTSLLPAIALALRPGGIAIFSGMEQSEAPVFMQALEEAGFTLRQESLDEGWWAVAAEPPE